MALPTLEKTWQFAVNQVVTATGSILNDRRKALYNIKAAMTGFANNPWVVVMSSDGVTAGSGDRWSDWTKILWGNPLSWIVLQQDCFATNFQICISPYRHGIEPNHVAKISISRSGGFTGGSTSDPPTAPDEIKLADNAEWVYSMPANSVDMITSVMQSTDGYCTRVFILSASTVRSWWMFERLSDSPMPDPTFISVRVGGPSPDEYFGNAWMLGRFNTINFWAKELTACGTDGRISYINSGAPSDFTGAYPIQSMGLYSTTSGAKGYCGRLSDIWRGSNIPALCSTYPATPDDKQFLHIREWIVPWDGSEPIIF
jgi:hypothetical protein